MSRALVVLAFFTLSAFARTEAPVAPLTFGPVRTFFAPAVATDGVQSFAVWSDNRDRVVHAIYGARLEANGTLLDPIGVRLFDGIGAPAIAYGDGRYFIVDAATRFAIVDRGANETPGPQASSPADVRASRPHSCTRDACTSAAETAAVRIVARGVLAENAAGSTRVVFNGRDFVVFWGYDTVKVSIVDRDGRATAPAELVPPGFEVRLHAVATNGSRIVVLYTRGAELRAAVASATGVPISDEAIAQNVFAETRVSIARSGSGFVAAWQSSAGPDVVAAALDANGAVVRGPTVVATNATSPQVAGNRLYAAEGDALFRRLVVRTIASDLTTGQPSTVYESQSLSILAYAANEQHVIVHLHHPNRSVVEEGLYVVGGEPKLVSRAAVAQFEPRLATAENGTLVAWREEQSLWASFGETTFFVVAGIIRDHAVAAAGRTHLIAWATYDRLRVQLYREHVPLASAMTLDAGAGPVAAAGDGEGFVVVWVRGNEIRIVRFSTAGDLVASYSFSYGNVTNYAAIALACDDGECLVVWRNQTARQTCPRFGCLVIDERVMALRFDSSLSPIEPAPLVLSEDLYGVSDLTVAADDGEYAVAWVNVWHTYVRTLDSDDTLILQGRHPALARAHGAWLLVREIGGELVARRLRDAAAPYEFTLFRDAQARSAPALAGAVVAYERTTRDEPAGGVPRIHVTAIEPPKTKQRAISR